MGSYMTFQLHWSMKLTVKILLNENTIGDIPSKSWHLMILMLKRISKLQFTCIFILLVPYTDLWLIIVIILIAVVIIDVIIVPYV